MTDLSLLITGLCACLCMGGASVQACSEVDQFNLLVCMNDEMGTEHVTILLAELQSIQSADSSDIVGALLANLEFKDLEKVTGAVCKFIEKYDAIKQCTDEKIQADCSQNSYFMMMNQGYDILIQENITLLCEPRCLVLPACVNAINKTLISDILPANEAKTQGSPYDADKLQRDCDSLKENLICALPLLNVCPGYIAAYDMLNPYLDSIEKDICKFNVTSSTTTSTRTTITTNSANDNGNQTSGADCKLYDIMSLLTAYILLFTTFL
ncbi:unnamed protein product [Owenia fusiformis]|uniref:Uncharacterized protein n=1 Tax=Owenia fusiformis TaxID=6347 RepID=A0A8J1U027_OWEFU|nr:unnamed protein product [Owenia fusiformis]